ncbi:MAG: adenine nucleotide alpha hydrolase family protein [Endomicrobiales bacterium]
MYDAARVLGLKPLAVHNDNDFESEAAARNLESMAKRLDVPLIRTRSKKQLAKKIVSEKIQMNAPFGVRLVVDQICEACQIGYETAAHSIAQKNGIALIFWGDSRDESTAAYHKLVEHPLPSRLQRILSPHAVHLFNKSAAGK